MSRTTNLIILTLLLMTAFSDSPAYAQWVEDGSAICDYSADQAAPVITADGDGETIAAWEDFRNGNWDIYAQRTDAYGNFYWMDDGIPVSTLSGPQRFPRIISDSQGGAIILYIDDPDVNADLYAQRIDKDGNTLWSPGGVAICTASDSLLSAKMVTDESGGAIISWEDYRNGTMDIFAQRIDAGGAVQWTANGVTICNDSTEQVDPAIISDGAGGAIIAWTDWRNKSDADIYAQRIDAAGTVLWTANGVPISAATGDQEHARAVTDGDKGAIIVWIDSRSLDADIYTQRIDKNGTVQWTTDGKAVCTASGSQENPRIITDNEYGAIVVWTDYRSGTGDIYAHRIDDTGTLKWLADGTIVCAASGDQSEPDLTPDGTGGAVITWRDGRKNPNDDIFAQSVDANGTSRWTMNGNAVSAAAETQSEPKIAPDGIGGAIITWTDYRNDNYDIFSQRMERGGYWGFPAPTIFAIRDVPGDQGGYVYLAWDASRLDPWPYQLISYYSVWRAINPTKVDSLTKAGAVVLTSAADIDASSRNSTPTIRIQHTAEGDYFWEFINYVFSAYLEHYSQSVQTLFDSTAVCSEYHYFQVIAHASGTNSTWASAPDSGYSVDNLSPAAPLGLSGLQNGNMLVITWHPNKESDLSHYVLYKGKTLDFVPQDPYLTLTDTIAAETPWAPDSNVYYYKLRAFDIHGNGSDCAVLRPDVIVATLLHGFTSFFDESGIKIKWQLSEYNEGARFSIRRAEAENDQFVDLQKAVIEREGLSFTFTDKTYEPGQTYRYRVLVEESGDLRMLFETSPISTPAMHLTLYQNHPNPFAPSTTIRYYLPENGRVTLEVYDVAGHRIKQLVDKMQERGYQTVDWNGRDNEGRPVSSGIYFYRLRAGKNQLARKMILLK